MSSQGGTSRASRGRAAAVLENPSPKFCWNCGDETHKISDCPREIRQENKNFFRKLFRLRDPHERERHLNRYKAFLVKLPPSDNEPEPDWNGLTRAEIDYITRVRHIGWVKTQAEAQEPEPMSPGTRIILSPLGSSSTSSSD